MRSLRLRLLLGAVFGVGAALAIAGVILVLIFGAHVHRRYVKELDDQQLQLAAAVQVLADGAVALRFELSDPAFQRPLSGLYWQVMDGDRTVLRSRSLWDGGLLDGGGPTSAPGALLERATIGPSREALVVIERVVVIDERLLRLAVAGDRKVIDEARGEFARDVALSLVVLGLLLSAASWLHVRAGLAPLGGLRDQLRRLRQGKTDRLEGVYPSELSGLVEDLNALLATQASEVERSRANAAKLGHGLKTPLAILAADARALRENGDTLAANSIEQEIEAMNVQVARILAAVRAVGPRKAVGAGTAIAPLLERLISVMKRLPRGAELDWALRSDDAKLSAPIDPRDLEDLFGNLLDNARKWARTRVDVSVTTTSDHIVVAVGDDGPGIPVDRRSEVLSDGVRLDRTVPGTGIGLAIAKDLTTLHGGTLALETSDLGGIQVTVHLMLRARSTFA